MDKSIEALLSKIEREYAYGYITLPYQQVVDRVVFCYNQFNPDDFEAYALEFTPQHRYKLSFKTVHNDMILVTIKPDLEEGEPECIFSVFVGREWLVTDYASIKRAAEVVKISNKVFDEYNSR